MRRRFLITLAAGALAAGTFTLVTAGPSGAKSSKSPYVIGWITIASGTNATPDRNNAVQLAVNQINKKGGADGHKFELKYYDSGIEPQQAVTAVEQAIGDKVNAIVGLPVSAGVQASAPIIKSSGIPALQLASDNSTDFSHTGATNLYRALATVYEESLGQANWIASRKPAQVGLWDDSDLNGSVQIKEVQQLLAKQGVTNVVHCSSPLQTTDTTSCVLQMKGVSNVVTTGFPVTEALFAKQMYQQGNLAPLTMSYGAYATVAFHLAPQEALSNDNFLSVCNAQTSTTALAKSYITAYEATYPQFPVLSSGPQGYDAIYLLAQAIKNDGGNTSSSAVAAALGKLKFNGVCGQYHSDSQHNMIHSVSIISTANTAEQLAAYTNLESVPPASLQS